MVLFVHKKNVIQWTTHALFQITSSTFYVVLNLHYQKNYSTFEATGFFFSPHYIFFVNLFVRENEMRGENRLSSEYVIGVM